MPSLVFEKLQPLDQSRQPLLLTFVIEAAQAIIGFTLAALAVRKLVSRETPVPWRCFRQCRCLSVIFRRALVLFVFFFVQPGKRFVQLGAIGIVFYSAFEEILTERKIFALRL